MVHHHHHHHLQFFSKHQDYEKKNDEGKKMSDSILTHLSTLLVDG